MRRIIIGFAAVIAAALSITAVASASPAQAFHFKFNGVFAEALWETSTASTITDTYISPSRTTNGQQQLFLDQFTQTVDQNGAFEGATDTSALVTSGFSFTINSSTFDTASVSGTNIPAQTCTFDANFDLIGCTDTTIDASAAWTGQGPVTQSVSGDHFHTFGFTETDHFSGKSREATASGTIGGLTLSTGDLVFADLGTARSGSVFVCTGANC
jgi:hypothetical protein